MMLRMREEENDWNEGKDSLSEGYGSHTTNARGSRRRGLTKPARWVKRSPFLGLHLAYFVLGSLAGAMSLWAAPKPEPLPFVDALFNAVSAITETGLPGVAIHRFSLSDRWSLLLLMVVGAPAFTAAIPLFLRCRLLLPHSIRRLTSSRRATPDKNCTPAPHLLPVVSPTANSLSTDVVEDEFLMDMQTLRVMSWVTAGHYLLCVLGGFLICSLCIFCSPHAKSVLKENHVDPALFALFAVVSAFGNCGYILLDDNLIPLNRASAMLLCLGALMLMGNTLYAPTMRLWIWLLQKTSRGEKGRVYEHILSSREQRFTHLFPRHETIWLLGFSMFINACQVLCMLSIDWKSHDLRSLGAGYKLVASLFQSIATRTGGMNVVNLANLSSPTLFLEVVAMYISTYPVLSIRQSTSKLERNIFVTQSSIVRSKDSFLFVAIFLVCFFERQSMRNDPVNFSFFNIVYEVISAYSNVGLSIGYDCSLRTKVAKDCKDIPCAFSGRWSVCGKMVLIMVMLVGRHRDFLRDSDWDIPSPVHTLPSP
ncbi:hypothetical protein KP509_30G037000 [Ceratopteris richardii]|uniref:Uncharacterized protein n=1 Tax=Ceratopteris richardii TaxID=49495 RepID=A0A8T2R1L9_CERRI|nr:hypothetical protein KP509_30G037000 [Ceratopteris richardii]